MRVFHKSPPPRPALQRRVPRPWDPPATEFPGIVPINTLQLGRSEQAAIAITGMSAYSNGFEFVVTALIHPAAGGFDAETPDGRMLTCKPYQISLQLSDGRTVTSDRPSSSSEPTGSILRPRGGGRHLALSALSVVGLVAATKRAAGVHLPLADARDRRNPSRHGCATDP